MIEIWHKQVKRKDITNMLSFLSSDDKTRANKITSTHRKNEFITGRVLLAKAISSKINSFKYKLHYLESGKPILENIDFNFNISHSKNNVFLVISPKHLDCGIDCEKIRDKKTSSINRIMQNYFHDNEINYINNSNDILISFFTHWTLKEAILKLKGRTVFNIKSQPAITINTHSIKIEKGYFYKSFQHNNCICSIAIKSESEHSTKLICV